MCRSAYFWREWCRESESQLPHSLFVCAQDAAAFFSVSSLSLRRRSAALRVAHRLDGEFECATGAIVIDEPRLAVLDIALEQKPAQRSLDFFLNNPLQRPGAVARI